MLDATKTSELGVRIDVRKPFVVLLNTNSKFKDGPFIKKNLVYSLATDKHVAQTDRQTRGIQDDLANASAEFDALFPGGIFFVQSRVFARQCTRYFGWQLRSRVPRCLHTSSRLS